MNGHAPTSDVSRCHRKACWQAVGTGNATKMMARLGSLRTRRLGRQTGRKGGIRNGSRDIGRIEMFSVEAETFAARGVPKRLGSTGLLQACALHQDWDLLSIRRPRRTTPPSATASTLTAVFHLLPISVLSTTKAPMPPMVILPMISKTATVAPKSLASQFLSSTATSESTP